jgi:hypothetical protein
MYTEKNYKTKKALVDDFKAGIEIYTYQEGPFPGVKNGRIALEGPHYPQPHKWYCGAMVENGKIVKILK